MIIKYIVILIVVSIQSLAFGLNTNYCPTGYADCFYKGGPLTWLLFGALALALGVAGYYYFSER